MVAEGFVPEAGILSINHENRKEDERCDFSYIALKFDSAGQGPDGIVPGTEVPDGDACIPKTRSRWNRAGDGSPGWRRLHPERGCAEKKSYYREFYNESKLI